MTEPKTNKLRMLSPQQLVRNPDNPRVFFRSDELDTLQRSIRAYGIQVPLAVYDNDDGTFTIIDGERRWRCASKLNLKSVPTIVQKKPSSLDNLLMMFNIHALREQWDLFTIANKLPRVKSLFKKARGFEPNEIELSELTGLARSQIRRCKFLLDLPDEYKTLLRSELDKPKQLQVLSEDFFIEMERSLKTVQQRVPGAIENIDDARHALLGKYPKVIHNITDFRKLSKIATAVRGLGVKESQARKALQKIFNPKNDVSIEQVFAEHFELRYDERKFSLNLQSVIDFLEYDEDQNLDEDTIELLRRMRLLIDEILGQ